MGQSARISPTWEYVLVATEESITVYVAGPFGFTRSGRAELNDIVLPGLAANGFVALNPWETGAQILGPVLGEQQRLPRALELACSEAGEANAQMITSCDAVLALLDGCDLDSGTCAEIGFAAALGKFVVGVRTDTRSCGDFPEIPINLQVKYFVEKSGGRLVEDFGEALVALARFAQTKQS